MQSVNNLIYAESKSFDPFFNLGFEKYLIDSVRDDDIILYLWQNEKTVVIGRNQNVYDECNLAELEKLGGKVARRMSGGGAVFHDVGNLNFTFIAKSDKYNVNDQMDIIIDALKAFGISAEKNGRNDMTVDGKKFSGSAFTKHGTTECHHGTLMISVNSDILDKVLNVSHEKLSKHNVNSVKSRTVNLSSLSPDITVDKLKNAIKLSFLKVYNASSFGSEINPFNIQLDEYTNYFSNENWIYGERIKFTDQLKYNHPLGEIKIELDIKAGKIINSRVYSDSLDLQFIDQIKDILPGMPYSEAKTRIEEMLL